jgi:dienelactone hydrolase
VSQGLQMKAALETLKKPVRMVVIKGATHGFLFRFESGKPKAERAMAEQAWNELLAFLKKNL